MGLFKGDMKKGRRMVVILFAAYILCIVILSVYYSGLRRKTFIVAGSIQDMEPLGVGLMGRRSKEWDEGNKEPFESGMEFDFELVNSDRYPVYDWKAEIVFKDGFDIDSSWNGVFSKIDNTLIVTPEEDTNVVHGNDMQTFGLVMLTMDDQLVGDYLLSYRLDIGLVSSELFWIVIALFILTAAVTVTNEINYARYRKVREKEEETQRILLESFKTFAHIIDAKDPYTQGHSLRVAEYSRLIAKEMGYSDDEQDRIYWIGMLHDVGKIGVTDAILQKPGRLDNSEYTMMQTHVDIGGEILKDFNALPGIADGARYHHERWDGKGYSSHLSGTQIPEIARIICVADSFDAMTSPRVYRKAMSVEHARHELLSCSGSQFDPKIVSFIIKLIDEGKAPVSIEE